MKSKTAINKLHYANAAVDFSSKLPRYSGSLKIDAFYLYSKLEKCVNLWPTTVYIKGCL